MRTGRLIGIICVTGSVSERESCARLRMRADVAQVRRDARALAVHAMAGRALALAFEERAAPRRVADFDGHAADVESGADERDEAVELALAEARTAASRRPRTPGRDRRRMSSSDIGLRNWPRRRLTPATVSPVAPWQVAHCAEYIRDPS